MEGKKGTEDIRFVKEGGAIEKLSQPEMSSIGKTIAVMSGKGGVGKSSVSALKRL
ncbi:MAG: hypothetical protein SCJ97_04800 [Bacillota bacterium]|nr:hypothetical protein [Bacillota bacterium]